MRQWPKTVVCPTSLKNKLPVNRNLAAGCAADRPITQILDGRMASISTPRPASPPLFSHHLSQHQRHCLPCLSHPPLILHHVVDAMVGLGWPRHNLERVSWRTKRRRTMRLARCGGGVVEKQEADHKHSSALEGLHGVHWIAFALIVMRGRGLQG